MSETPWVIELRGPHIEPPLIIRLDHKLVLGRVDQQNPSPIDVDLSSYEAEDYGVSRQHLILHTENDQLMMTDLGSGNGTQLNGLRVEPNKHYLLKNNDQLRLGRLPVEIGVIISPSHGSIFQKDDSLQLEDHHDQGKGQLILIVEDDSEVARVLALILDRSGYTTHIVHDVVSAMRFYNQKHPSAVLLDVMLPDINGLEFCRYVRRSVENNSVPVIVVSAVSTADKVTQAIEAGADIFLGKPVSARELRHVVSSMITQHESGVMMLKTKHLAGTAPLQAMPPESRREALVLFIAGQGDTPLTLTVKHPVTFGRAAKTTDKGYIDLSRYNAIDHGVSRVHMTLLRKDNQFYVEDANSVNGTFLNGEPLAPHEPHLIKNADEIRLGQLRMYAYFLTDDDMPDGSS